MTPRAPDAGRRLLDGMFWVLLAEALFPLTAVVTAGGLTRRLDKSEYGQLTLTVSLISWIQISLLALFARATIVFVRRADDWKAVGATVVRYQLMLGLMAFAALFASANVIASLLADPELG